MTLSLRMLPAGEGDALWLQWGPAHDRRQMLIDLGVTASGKAFHARMEQLPSDRRTFDLLVVTHIDTDHILGVLSGVVNPLPLDGYRFEDVWFNGWSHLHGQCVEAAGASKPAVLGTALEGYGGVQGEQLAAWLTKQNWNHAFDGCAIVRAEGALGPTIPLAHGLSISVVGPTRRRLENLRTQWREDVLDALEKGRLQEDEVTPGLVDGALEPYGRALEPPVLHTREDLKALADERFKGDNTFPNGSSIALLVEYDGKRILLTGDAYANDLVESLRPLRDESTGRVRLDAIKVPHHGSANNLSSDLVESLQCERWLISTNGVKHCHPDASAVARILSYGSPPKPVLYFNEPSKFNGWWDRDDWRQQYRYETHYGTHEDGLELVL